MAYKAFDEIYKTVPIRHLLLEKHGDDLISPPFATELCKEYNQIAFWDGNYVEYRALDLPPATSKFNAITNVRKSTWMVPYGIWDEMNTAVQVTNRKIEYHSIDAQGGKGQFYSIASNGKQACAFPLGYENTHYLIWIDKNGLRTDTFQTDNVKCHMGTVWCNGKFWSMPRGDNPNYQDLVSYDGSLIKRHKILCKENTRKYSDIVVVDNTLYSLPFGEGYGHKTVTEFDTTSNTIKYHELDIPDFAKKYNAQVLVDECIIGLPYGDERSQDSNWGVVFNTVTKESFPVNIGFIFGGKYRFRSGLAYKGRAVFLPSGSPNCPIISVDKHGGIQIGWQKDKIFGRPLLYKDKIYCIVYDIRKQQSFICSIDEKLNITQHQTLV